MIKRYAREVLFLMIIFNREKKKRLLPQDATNVSKFYSTYSVTDGKGKVWGPALASKPCSKQQATSGFRNIFKHFISQYMLSWSEFW